MRIPDEYYVVLPSGGLDDVKALLRGKSAQGISAKQQLSVDTYLVDNGEWTDVKPTAVRKRETYPFIFWTADGIDRLITEKA